MSMTTPRTRILVVETVPSHRRAPRLSPPSTIADRLGVRSSRAPLIPRATRHDRHRRLQNEPEGHTTGAGDDVPPEAIELVGRKAVSDGVDDGEAQQQRDSHSRQKERGSVIATSPDQGGSRAPQGGNQVQPIRLLVPPLLPATFAPAGAGIKKPTVRATA